MRKKKTVKKRTEQVGESGLTPTPEEIYAGCEKWFKIIDSLNLPNEVLEDNAAVDAILREKGYVK